MGNEILLSAGGAVYLGTEQFLTLVSVITICGAILIFLVKYQFTRITTGIDKTAEKLEEVKSVMHHEIEITFDKTNERIDKLEERTNQELGDLRQDMNDLKGEFSITFVQREDFFRYMNGMEANVKDTNNKVDKILMMMTEGRKKGNE